MTPGNEEIGRVLSEYGMVPDAAMAEKIQVYVSLLRRWNERVALTAVTDLKQILRFHFGESVYAAKQGLIEKGRLADVGSGAGFPGIPLSLVCPALEVTLIEPNLKKCVFLGEVKRKLSLVNVEISRGRMEDYRGTEVDIVTSRAVGRPASLFEFCRAKLNPMGKLVMWLGMDDAKVLAAKHSEWSWSDLVRIPGSERRCILAGRRIANVPRETFGM